MPVSKSHFETKTQFSFLLSFFAQTKIETESFRKDHILKLGLMRKNVHLCFHFLNFSTHNRETNFLVLYRKIWSLTKKSALIIDKIHSQLYFLFQPLNSQVFNYTNPINIKWEINILHRYYKNWYELRCQPKSFS